MVKKNQKYTEKQREAYKKHWNNLKNPELNKNLFKKENKIRNTGRTRFKKGQPSWNKNKTKEELLTHYKNGWKIKHFKGKEHYNWQNGKSFEEYTINWNDELKDLIRKRDNYICQECGIHQNELDSWNKKLDVHHIDYNKKNLNPENLITLCRICHIKTNYNRKYWCEYFRNKI